MRRITFFVGIVFFGTCAASAQTVVDSSGDAIPQEILSQLLAGVTKDFRDPVAAQFRDLRWSDEDATVQPENVSKTICGSVNAKNGLGGYVGFATFAWNYAEPTKVSLQPSAGGNDVVRRSELTWLSVRGCPVRE